MEEADSLAMAASSSHLSHTQITPSIRQGNSYKKALNMLGERESDGRKVVNNTQVLEWMEADTVRKHLPNLSGHLEMVPSRHGYDFARLKSVIDLGAIKAMGSKELAYYLLLSNQYPDSIREKRKFKPGAYKPAGDGGGHGTSGKQPKKQPKKPPRTATAGAAKADKSDKSDEINPSQAAKFMHILKQALNQDGKTDEDSVMEFVNKNLSGKE